jgi:VanZ family protein
MNFIRYQLPLFLWAGLIFWLSSLSRLPHVETPIIAADKLAHMSVFFVFCWFSRRALFFQTASTLFKRWSLLGAFLLSCVYGYFDEVHQLYVPGRSYDYFDMLADATGALCFVVLFVLIQRWKERQARTS